MSLWPNRVCFTFKLPGSSSLFSTFGQRDRRQGGQRGIWGHRVWTYKINGMGKRFAFTVRPFLHVHDGHTGHSSRFRRNEPERREPAAAHQCDDEPSVVNFRSRLGNHLPGPSWRATTATKESGEAKRDFLPFWLLENPNFPFVSVRFPRRFISRQHTPIPHDEPREAIQSPFPEEGAEKAHPSM